MKAEIAKSQEKFDSLTGNSLIAAQAGLVSWKGSLAGALDSPANWSSERGVDIGVDMNVTAEAYSVFEPEGNEPEKIIIDAGEDEGEENVEEEEEDIKRLDIACWAGKVPRSWLEVDIGV